MAGYNEIRGLRVKYLSDDPSNAENGQVWYNSTSGNLRVQGIGIEAFSSATPMPVAKSTYHRAGTMTAGLFCAGAAPPTGSPSFSTTTEEWNGLGFSQGGAIGTALYTNTGFGTQTAGVSAAGRPTNPTSGDTAATFEYDGSTWTSVNAANTAARTRQSFGILTAGAMVGGYRQATSTYTNATEEYDGTNWTTVTAMPVNASSANAIGTQTAAIVTASGAPTVNTNVIAYDGTNWTSSPSMNIARIRSAAGGTGATSTAGLLIGGGPYSPTATATAEKWDGTSFSNSPASLTTARYGAGLSDGNTNGMMVGGYQGTAFQSAVEEFNSSTNTITAAAWSAGANFPTSSSQVAGAGSRDAGLGIGGYPEGSSPTGKSYEYNGVAWSAEATLNPSTGTAGVNAATGTQTACVNAQNTSGGPPYVYTATGEYDGSSWSNATARPTDNYANAACGTQTAGLFFGGASSPTGMSAVTLSYDGTNWTAEESLSTARRDLAGSGTATAGLGTAGYTNPPSTYYTNTEEYGGESWTAGGSLLVATRSGQSSGTQGDAIFFGGNTPTKTTATFGYDGTSWSTRPSLATARTNFGAGATSPVGAAWGAGGYYPGSSPNRTNTTEHFNVETSVANTSNITTS